MSDNIKKVNCKYWDKCYQKNPEHHKKYNHPPNIENSSSELCSTSNVEHEKKDSSKNIKIENELSSTSSNVEHEKKDSSKNIKIENELSSTSSSKDSDQKNEVTSKSKNIESSNETLVEKEQNNMNNTTESSSKDINNENGSLKEIDISEEYNEVIKNLSGKNYFEIFQKRIKYSQKAEYDELVKTPEFIRHKFLVEMPTDFYKFWDFCVLLSEQKNEKEPQNIFNNIKLKLVGPFDYLSGKFINAKIHEPANYLRHWRFYYDPPEFQTIFVKANTGVHYGYWRDEPQDKENLLCARNDMDQGCEFKFVGGNCFETLLYYLNNDCSITPFNKKQINDLIKLVHKYAEENDINLNSLESLKKERDKKVVCKTFHTAGLVVPYDHKTKVGYRPLLESNSNLKKILNKLKLVKENPIVIDNVLESLQPIITGANIAMDECDFGTNVELGIDLFCSGYSELHDVIRTLLIPGYSMLQRPQFIAIMKTHLESRVKDLNLSIFE